MEAVRPAESVVPIAAGVWLPASPTTMILFGIVRGDAK